tara:strand:+ start:330 stop:713 length:384 start_codon:yes stop_codon:yes gene_type:complete
MNGDCCTRCNEIFVTAARCTGVDDIERQLIYLNKMEEENDLPSYIIDKKDEVWAYLFNGRDLLGDDLDREIARLEAEINDLAEEVIKEPFGPVEMQKLIQEAYDNAIKNEAYEAAAVLHKRLEELKG